MTVSMQFIGFDKLSAAFGEAAALVQSEVIPYALEYAIQIAQQESKAVCPVRTGFLRDSIHVEYSSQGEAHLIASAPYAGYVEYGTSKMTGRHYMASGFMAALPAFQQAIAMKLGEIVGFAGRHFV